ncbi:hypothetical protein J3458_019972 [Metarhizium acridum]|uniref:Uncharacterized protein n=1 Tax=Metarhizium acridum (strain CQMa 102) TaxID=655827 RepID=E9E8N0_METAQ|nr:uncharacterized protein MAC_06245 [Metarhizium acridum CQMa 102]EFY87759.1 hypothetical protein MAC_06245 [Metarhizium acridum CQMa 102]KAG8408964.1 hypothetical protein J3458_019972 [Metarhizium acridum]
MAGSQQYKNVEIHYVLKAIHMRMPSDWVRMRFEQRFNRKLSENQVRYLKNKYGRDPRFGTPVANSTSTFGAPNPRIGPGYWPPDDILAIDYQAFEERGDDVAEPNLRVVAPISGIMAPTPSPMAPHVPVVRSGGPDGSELAGALGAHTTSVTGQKRARGKDEEEEVDGLTENRLPNFHKTSRVDASASCTDHFSRPEYSAAFLGPPPIYGNDTMLSSDGAFTPTPLGPVLPACPPVARTPTFCLSGPVHTYALGQANQLPMNSFHYTQLRPMGQCIANNMYTDALTFQDDAYADVSGRTRHGVPGDMSTVPFCNRNANFSFNGGFGQHVSNDLSVPGLGYQHGPKGGFDGFGQTSAVPYPWDLNSTFVHPCMDLLNSTPSFLGLDNTSAIGTQNYTPHQVSEHYSPFTPASNMTQPAVSLQPVSNQVPQQISLDGAAVPETNSCGNLKTILNNNGLDHAASKEYRERLDRELVESLSVHGSDTNSLHFFSDFPSSSKCAFNQNFDVAHLATNMNASTAKTASSDEVFETYICDLDRSTTASTVCTRATSVSQLSEPVHKEKEHNENRLEVERPKESLTTSAAQAALGVSRQTEEK